MKILFYNTKARDTRSPIMQTSDKRKGFEEPSVRTMLLSWKQVLTICNGAEIDSM